jgi:hypothetical protein
VSASQVLLLLIFSSFVFLMETDDSLLECCHVVTLCLAGMSEEELLMIPFVDLTGLCHSVGLRVVRVCGADCGYLWLVSVMPGQSCVAFGGIWW